MNGKADQVSAIAARALQTIMSSISNRSQMTAIYRSTGQVSYTKPPGTSTAGDWGVLNGNIHEYIARVSGSSCESEEVGVRAESGSRRDAILAAAADLFWTKGYDATTMSELASALGLRKASLYHHIRKKESLLYEFSLSSLDRISSAVKEALDPEANPLARLRALIEEHLVTALEDRNKHATMLTELRALTADERETILHLRDDYDLLVEKVGRVSGAVPCGRTFPHNCSACRCSTCSIGRSSGSLSMVPRQQLRSHERLPQYSSRARDRRR